MSDAVTRYFDSTERINKFLLTNNLTIKDNPCISPDFCLDWQRLKEIVGKNPDKLHRWSYSKIETELGEWYLLEELETGEHCWELQTKTKLSNEILEGQTQGKGTLYYFPATFKNLLHLKNLLQNDATICCAFPSAGAALGRSTIGVGARFTTLHWPAVEWVMAKLKLGLTANQNSIPRELVYDVNTMLAGQLDTVPFPFIGTDVPEGHQGQSVEGMSHGCILSKLKSGFHKNLIEWSFNADHQPIGGKFDVREERPVAGCVLASYITFDLSPELAQTITHSDPHLWVLDNVPNNILEKVREALFVREIEVMEGEFDRLIAYVWPAIQKMKSRDQKYTAIRQELFTAKHAQSYLRELSIDELPGLTTPETTAVMLALCEALEMKINFIAPAFGFQKNLPYNDHDQLRRMIEQQWDICSRFEVSIGFHSGSGKSAENYQVMGEVTEQNLEIKTSGRYTYEMGRALYKSSNATDQALWKDWYNFTVEMAVAGAFSQNATEQQMARGFITRTLKQNMNKASEGDVFASIESCRQAIAQLPASPEHMFWFEYNFLFVLAADGKADKAALGDHGVKGYSQRSRFYKISPEARLEYAKNVARYLLFLAQNTGLRSEEECSKVREELERAEDLALNFTD